MRDARVSHDSTTTATDEISKSASPGFVAVPRREAGRAASPGVAATERGPVGLRASLSSLGRDNLVALAVDEVGVQPFAEPRAPLPATPADAMYVRDFTPGKIPKVPRVVTAGTGRKLTPEL